MLDGACRAGRTLGGQECVQCTVPRDSNRAGGRGGVRERVRACGWGLDPVCETLNVLPRRVLRDGVRGGVDSNASRRRRIGGDSARCAGAWTWGAEFHSVAALTSVPRNPALSRPQVTLESYRDDLMSVDDVVVTLTFGGGLLLQVRVRVMTPA